MAEVPAPAPAAGPAPRRRPAHRRVKTPTVLQMEAVECGAAALAIVMAHHGRIVPLEELRIECGVSRDGTKATNVLKAARRYGFVAKGFKYGLDKLFELQPPTVLFWNFNHFLVLEGFRRGRACLNDPAQGPREVDLDELDASFSGVVLTFEPGPDFEAGGEKRSMRAALRRRLAGLERALSFVVLCGLFLVIPGLVIPTFSRIFIDEFLISGRVTLIQSLLIGMGLTAALRMALTALQQHYLLRMETRIALRTSAEFFQHVLRLPVSYFGQRFAGEIGSRVLINNKVANLISGRLATTILDSVLIVFYGALMLIYDVTLTLACVALALVNVAVLQLAARRRTDLSRRLQQEGGKLTGTAMNGLQMIETIKATGSEGDLFARWAGYQAKALNAEQDLGRLDNQVSAVPPLVNTLTTAVVLLLGGLKIMDGELTVGLLVAYQSLVASFTRPLNTLVAFGASIQELEADMTRLDDVLRYPADVHYAGDREVDPRSRGLLKLSGEVEMRGVTFGYSPLAKPLIEGFDLSVGPGQRVALVGGSGSGKSTIARLIAGLYQPWEGEILFDSMSRRDLPPQLLSNSLALVDQDIFLFSGSIRENVAMWDSTIPDVNVITACKDAAVDGVVETRDGSYGSEIAEGGTNFSGGQRQRLEIARSLVGDPTILILDEATSALDPTTEARIDDHLRRRGCTCIIVAHRLSTIRDCDEIIVLDRGKIVQRGTHEEMKSAPGPYARLIED
jgi:NHLM bacteriocin system ABC transporter peptidase/ATP-binding protein